MNKDDLLKMAENPQYIEGIYNYCDRWCERCSMTSRCLNYAITEENLGDLSDRDMDNKIFWEKLQEIFQLTMEMVTEWAEENGVDLDAIDMEAVAEEEHRRRVEAKNHELSQAARGYSDLVEMWFDQGESLPFDVKGQTIYYTGPSPARPGQSIGSAGPTTSGRMDVYSPRLIAEGLKGMIGKGMRSPVVKDAMKEHKAIYMATIGGTGALISKTIRKSVVVAYEELGTEAILRLEVVEFPVTVINDIYGGDLYQEGKSRYRID